MSLLRYFSICLICICAMHQVSAQKATDTSKKVDVEIVSAGYIERVPTDSIAFNKLVENVELKQEGTLMYCDSAYLYSESNNVEAFGNVVIIQADGTTVHSDYLRYTGNTKTAFLQGNVSLTDGNNNLWTTEVVYNLTTKVGVYSLGGTLQSDATTLTSNSGIYNIRSKEARFIEDVHVYDPDYIIISDEMGYNTETKVTTFFAPSTVTSDSSVLTTHCGTYKSIEQTAHFPCRSSILTKEQYMEADSLFYNKMKGFAKARGDVIAIDTAQQLTLYCQVADMNEFKKTTLATVKPVMKKMDGEDSLFIRADTFYIAPVVPICDSIQIVRTEGRGKNKKEIIQMVADTTCEVDTAELRYFIGFHHVKIFSDSMQGLCDSISYTQKDSIMRMMYDPIVWSRKSQITGDTILLYTDSSKVKKIYVPDKAFVVSQSGPDRAKLYDQIQGKTLTGFFENNAIKEVLVKPNAEAIYFAQDENDAYLGVNEASSARLRATFDDNGVEFIIFEQEFNHTLTPLTEADLPNLRLNRFSWQVERRPKSRAEIFE